MSVSVMARALAPPLLAIASLACEPPREVSLRAPISPRIDVKSALGDRARAACADEILGALHRRGLVVTQEGTLVLIELWLAQEMAPDNFPNTWSALNPGVLEVLPSPPPSFVAELTATLHSAGASPTVLRAAGTSAATPCAVAGERLAAQLIERMGTR